MVLAATHQVIDSATCVSTSEQRVARDAFYAALAFLQANASSMWQINCTVYGEQYITACPGIAAGSETLHSQARRYV